MTTPKKKTTPWRATAMERWVRGEWMCVVEEAEGWSWTTARHGAGAAPTEAEAMRAAMAAVRGAKG